MRKEAGVQPKRPSARLAHGWRLLCAGCPKEIGGHWIRPAVRAIPTSIAVRLPPCEIRLAAKLEDAEAVSRWTLDQRTFRIEAATESEEPHDVAMEILVCLGQALWEVCKPDECVKWLGIVGKEIDSGVTGEIDEASLEAKRNLLSGEASARNPRRLNVYARTSFAGTVAEYVHSLWHDVTIRAGPEHLPQEWLRKRLRLLERWFPPNRGFRLFPEPGRKSRKEPD